MRRKENMPAPKGNQNNKKFKTQEARRLLFEHLIVHLEQGYDQNTFPDCDWDTVEVYIKSYPIEFPSQKISEAKRKGINLLEKLGHGGMTGKLPGFNPTTWIFIMKNKAHWKDRQDFTSDDQAIEGPVIYVPKKNDK